MKKIKIFLNVFIINLLFTFNKVKADGCSDTIGSQTLVDEIVKIFHIIGYVTLVIAVILGMLDFFKVIAGGDKADLKNVAQKFIKRLLAVALFFILPAIVEWLLEISGVINGGTCLN